MNVEIDDQTDLGLIETQDFDACPMNLFSFTNSSAITNINTNPDRLRKVIDEINECKSKFILIKNKKTNGLLYDPTILDMSVVF